MYGGDTATMESFSHQIEGTIKKTINSSKMFWWKFKNEKFLQDSVNCIINLHICVKQTRDAWDIHKMMELQELLPGSQLLVVEEKPFSFCGTSRSRHHFYPKGRSIFSWRERESWGSFFLSLLNPHDDNNSNERVTLHDVTRSTILSCALVGPKSLHW